GRLEIDLFIRVLADIGDPKIICRPIECEAPWVTYAERPDLGPCAQGVHERIIRRNADAPGVALDVDPQHFTEQPRQVLSIILWIAARPAVAHADVQVAVGTEPQ